MKLKIKPPTRKPLLDRIAEMREICRWAGDEETAKLLDEAGRTIDQMWDELLAYGYATDVIRRECGLPINSENLSDVYDYICELKAKI